VGEECTLLRNDGNSTLVWWSPRLAINCSIAVDGDGAARRSLEACNNTKKCGLATTRWTDESGDAPMIHDKIDGVEHLVLTEKVGDVV
jgi:hypothetical protein